MDAAVPIHGTKHGNHKLDRAATVIVWLSGHGHVCRRTYGGKLRGTVVCQGDKGGQDDRPEIQIDHDYVGPS